MKVAHQLQIRSGASGAYRSGEWADVVGVAIVTPDGKEPRLCYFVAFPDGKTDYWPITERHDMRAA